MTSFLKHRFSGVSLLLIETENILCTDINVTPTTNLTMSYSAELQVHNYAKYLTAPTLEPLS